MVSILKFRIILRHCHFVGENEKLCRVGLFWDLDNKPPNSIPPYQVANKLRIAAASFGVVRHMVAYANTHTFSVVPRGVRESRKERQLLYSLENKGVIKRNEPHLCRVCGRKFYTNEKLVNHFKQLHQREHVKRVNQIESARGSRKVKLVGKFAMKMEKYKKAARTVLTPKVGYGLADELKRAGFWVQTVLDRPQAADVALQKHMVDMMDHRRIECLVLVSDDSDFVDVIKEAKLRCLKTVIIGDVSSDGVLKRTADTAFSWEEILMGKAKKEAVSVVENWNDRDILKRLEWTYNPDVDKKRLDIGDDTVAETSGYIMWAEAMGKLEGMESADRERLWPQQVQGFKDLSQRLKLQDEVIVSDAERLSVTQSNVKMLQRHFQADTLPWIQRLKQKEQILQQRILRVMRIVEALEGKGCRIPLTKGEAELAEKLATITRQLKGSGAELSRRVQNLLGLSRVKANSNEFGNSAYLPGSTKIHEQSLTDLQEVLHQQMDAIARLGSVLKRDARNMEIMMAEDTETTENGNLM